MNFKAKLNLNLYKYNVLFIGIDKGIDSLPQILIF